MALGAVLVLAVVANAQTPTTEEPTSVPTEGGETPDGEPTATEDGEPGAVQETDALVIAVVPDEELEEGDTFEAEVRVEDAEHVAAYSFSLEFDPSHLEIVDQDATTEGIQFGSAIGDFLQTGDRENINCDAPQIRPENRITVLCVTNDAPVCLGGPEGASGSGTLGTFEFTVTSEGNTDLTVAASKLILDDFDPCSEERPIEVQPVLEGATVKVKGEGFNWLLVGGVVAVVAVLMAGGAFAYARTRSRATGE
jgi:hypothetical protein